MINSAEFLGRGWAFPPQFGRGGTTVATVDGARDIEQGLYVLLATRVGERVMREQFGSELYRSQFEPITAGLLNTIHDTVVRAIVRYEARVDLLNVSVEQSEETRGLLLIAIIYQIRGTNSRFNMVYPFYVEEGNG